jgi:hypothetical protein
MEGAGKNPFAHHLFLLPTPPAMKRHVIFYLKLLGHNGISRPPEALVVGSRIGAGGSKLKRGGL